MNVCEWAGDGGGSLRVCGCVRGSLCLGACEGLPLCVRGLPRGFPLCVCVCEGFPVCVRGFPGRGAPSLCLSMRGFPACLGCVRGALCP